MPQGRADLLVETMKHIDPTVLGGFVVAAKNLPSDPVASDFGAESFEDGLADFSTLSKANNEDLFSSATSMSSFHKMCLRKCQPTVRMYPQPCHQRSELQPHPAHHHLGKTQQQIGFFLSL